VVRRDLVGAVRPGDIASLSEQVECFSGVSRVLRTKRRAKRDDVLGQRVIVKRSIRALAQDRSEFGGVVWREGDRLFAERRPDFRREVFAKRQIVADADDSNLRLGDIPVTACSRDLIEDRIVLANIIDLVEDENRRSPRLSSAFQRCS
jgi:hypothetical protein